MAQSNNSNRLVVPGAQNAIDQMKYEIANEFGVNLGPDTTARANGSVGGEIIRITVPALTEERRKEYAKNVWKFAEHAKVAIRNIRRDANDEIKKCDGSEDEIKDGQNRVQKLTDKFVKEVDEIGKVKEKDIMTV